MMAMYESFDAARARGDFAVLPELVRREAGLGKVGRHVAGLLVAQRSGQHRLLPCSPLLLTPSLTLAARTVFGPQGAVHRHCGQRH